MIAGDRELARRDAALPGLPLVLDEAALSDALRDRLPGRRIDRVHIRSARYRPQSSCVVGVELEAGRARLLGAVCAFRRDVPGTLAEAQARGGHLLLRHAVAVMVLPAERRLRTLGRVLAADTRARMLARAVPDRPSLWNAELEVLRYAPERRFAARLDGEGGDTALLKAYTESGYRRAYTATETLGARVAEAGGPRIAGLLGARGRQRVLVFEWLGGRSLDALLDGPDGLLGTPAAAHGLAALHALPAAGLRPIGLVEHAARLRAAVADAAMAGEPLAARAERLAGVLEPGLLALPTRTRTLHGRFEPAHVLAGAHGSPGAVALGDVESAGAGDPAVDLAAFLADLELRVLDDRLPAARAAAVATGLLDAYVGPDGDAAALGPALAVHLPVALMHRIGEPFRRREADWPERMAAIVGRAEELAAPIPGGAGGAPQNHSSAPWRAVSADPPRPAARHGALDRVAVAWAAAGDAARLGLSPGPLRLARAWPDQAGGLVLEYADRQGRIVGALWRLDGEAVGGPGVAWARTGGEERVLLVGPGADGRLPGLGAAASEPGAKVIAHRPGRRAVVRLADGREVRLVRPHRVGRLVAALDRARRLGASSGFAAPAGHEAEPAAGGVRGGSAALEADPAAGSVLRGGFAAPAVLEADPAAGRVICGALPGRPLLECPPEVAGRAAGAAIRTLHDGAAPEGVGRHDAAAEARVLWRWLSDLAPYAPERAATLSAAVERAVDALAGLPTAPATPVHRDLHDGHLLIAPDGAVGLLECDALAAGDPALDLGNLLAHLTWRVRQHRLDRAGAGDTAAAILDGYAAGPDERARAAAYAAAAELRLACVYAFRPRWSAIASGVAAPALLPAITAP